MRVPTRALSHARVTQPPVVVAFIVLAITSTTACRSEYEPEGRAPFAPRTEGPEGLTDAEWGERLFREHGCIACHSVNGVRGVGGALDHLFGSQRMLTDGRSVSVDAAYLRESIEWPGRKIVRGFSDDMPSYEGRLSDAQIDAIVAFIRANR